MKRISGQREADLNAVARAIVNGEFHRGTIGEGDAANKLLIDCDNSPPRFHELIRNLKSLGIKPHAIYYKASAARGHWHLCIFMREKMPLLARIFCQIRLGSDSRRETHNFVRAYYYGRNDKYAQILFGRKLPYGKETGASSNGRTTATTKAK